jgi:hypothetical protein
MFPRLYGALTIIGGGGIFLLSLVLLDGMRKKTLLTEITEHTRITHTITTDQEPSTFLEKFQETETTSYASADEHVLEVITDDAVEEFASPKSDNDDIMDDEALEYNEWTADTDDTEIQKQPQKKAPAKIKARAWHDWHEQV